MPVMPVNDIMTAGNIFERLYQTPTVASEMQRYHQKSQEPLPPELHPERHHIFRSATLYKPTVAYIRSTKHYQEEKLRKQRQGDSVDHADKIKKPQQQRQSLLRTPLRPHEKLTPKIRSPRRPKTSSHSPHYSQSTALSRQRELPRRPITPDTAASTPSPPPRGIRATSNTNTKAVNKSNETPNNEHGQAKGDSVNKITPPSKECDHSVDDDLSDLLATEHGNDDKDECDDDENYPLIEVPTLMNPNDTGLFDGYEAGNVCDMDVRSHATLESMNTADVGDLLDSQEDEELRELFDNVRQTGDRLSLQELEEWLETSQAPWSHKMALSRAFIECNQRVSRETFPIFYRFMTYYAWLWAAFSQIDTDKDQKISKAEFLSLSDRMNLDRANMNAVFDEMIVDLDEKMVDFDAFCSWSSKHYMQFDKF